MKAIQMAEAGGPEVLKVKEVPDPKPGENDVLVELKAAGINPIDYKLRTRGTLYPDRLPAVLGCDGAGIVQEVGKKVQRFKKGDEVYFCYGGLGDHPGTYARYAAVPEAAVAKKPASLGFEEAAAVPLVTITAWESLHDRLRIREGYHVLIHAGAGGVGHTAIQLAKLAGCRVATTVSSQQKAEFVSKVGADRTIFYKEEDFVAAAAEWSGKGGVDGVLDTVGGQTFRDSFRAIRFSGDVVSLVALPSDLDWDELKRKNGRLSLEYMLIPMKEGLMDELRRQAGILEQTANLIDGGRIAVHVQRVLPLEEAAEAHRLLEQGLEKGKIVLSID